MRVSFIGLGKLGLPLATCFAKNGVEVFAIDKNTDLIKKLNSGNIPWIEEGLENNLSESSQNISFTNSYDCISKTTVSVVLVNTPSVSKDGSFSNIYVEQSLIEIAKRMKKNHLIILSSTVMPGSILESLVPLVENISGYSYNKREFGFAYVPDFVALGNVISNFENPDFLVIGSNCEDSFISTKKLYERILKNDCDILHRSLSETELIKVSLNAYITTKISFANFLGIMAMRMPGDININNVTNVVGLDKRIGKSYFSSGVSYGGTCFPRDTWAFMKCAEKVGLEAYQMFANEKINNLTDEEWLSAIVNSGCHKVVLLGASFKPGTSVVTEGLAVKIIPELLKRKYDIYVFDSNIEALDNIKNIFADNNGIFYGKLGDTIPDGSVVLITIPDSQFVSLTFTNCKLLDPWKLIKK